MATSAIKYDVPGNDGGSELAKKKRVDAVDWENNTSSCPKIQGNLEISKCRSGIFIGGDPTALRSLAKVLVWLADIDQESLATQPDGERFHVHLHARDAAGFNSLTPFSSETEVCRLDAKGAGELPEKYGKLQRKTQKRRTVR